MFRMLICLAAVMVADDTTAAKLVGKWQSTTSSLVYTFDKDGKYQASIEVAGGVVLWEGTYEVNGSQLKLQSQDESTHEIKDLTSSKLVLHKISKDSKYPVVEFKRAEQ